MTYRPDDIQTVMCPRCRREMKFIRCVPKLSAAFPELHVFSCSHCHEVETREIIQAVQARAN